MKWAVHFLFLLTALLLALVINTSLPIYGKEEAEDVLDLTLEDLLNEDIPSEEEVMEKVIRIPENIVVITRQEIETFGCQSLEELLSGIPGFFPFDRGSVNGMQLGVRGASSGTDSVMILINGVPQSEGYGNTTVIDLLNVPIESIDRLEVTRGPPVSVRYGPGAFAAVINIITTDVESDYRKNMVTGSYRVPGNSLPGYRAVAKVSGKENKLSFSFNAGISKNHGPIANYSDLLKVTNGMVNPSLLEPLPPDSFLEMAGLDAGASTKGQLDKNKKYFNVSGRFKSFHFDISLKNTKKGILFKLPGNRDSFDGNYSNMSSATAYMRYRKSLSKKIIYGFYFYYNRSSFQSNYYVNPQLLAGSQAREPGDFFGSEKILASYYETGLELVYIANKKTNLFWGAVHRGTTESSNEIDIPSLHDRFTGNTLIEGVMSGHTGNTSALYFQADYRHSEKLRFLLGFRLEYSWKLNSLISINRGNEERMEGMNVFSGSYHQKPFDFVPRAAVLYSINSKNSLRLFYGESIKRPGPGALALDNAAIASGSKESALVPAKIRGLELHLNSVISKKISMDFTLFYNRFENPLRSYGQVFPGCSYWPLQMNSGTGSAAGTEFILKSKPMKNLFFDFCAGFQGHSSTAPLKDAYNGNGMPYAPNILLYGKFAYKFKKATLGFRGRFVGASGDIKNYLLLSGSLRLKVKSKNRILSDSFFIIDIYNIFAAKILYPPSGDVPWAGNGIPGMGRRVSVSFGKKF
ncbi:MAG: TonB-dependent receptor [bacterium]|nr:TonB-dependent receptor [bacterium]